LIFGARSYQAMGRKLVALGHYRDKSFPRDKVALEFEQLVETFAELKSEFQRLWLAEDRENANFHGLASRFDRTIIPCKQKIAELQRTSKVDSPAPGDAKEASPKEADANESAAVELPGEAKTERLQTGDLDVRIIDTGKYPGHVDGLSGILDIRHKALPEINPILEQGSWLNFEHVFSGDKATYPRHIMAPRLSPMSITRVNDTTVVLHQANAQDWPIETTITYELVPPHYVDFTIQYKVLEGGDWAKHNYLGVFFASYLQFPADRCIYFLGRNRASRDEPYRWVKSFSPAHGTRSTHRSVNDRFEMPRDEGFNIALATGDSDYEFSHPFYFGRFREMVVAQMFDSTSIVRFAQSPNAGGLKPHPAWDFFILTPNFKVGETYSTRGRLVYKPFVNAADILGEYEKWIKLKIERPVGEPVYGEPFMEDKTGWPYRQ
jgi:hypothetical protein